MVQKYDKASVFDLWRVMIASGLTDSIKMIHGSQEGRGSNFLNGERNASNSCMYWNHLGIFDGCA